ncbi:MAG: hypothetical protein R2729_23120 [Bryobacteraceae bacterium]
MTKTQLHYELTRPLDETLMERVAAAHRQFGMMRVRPQAGPDGDLTELVVDYDASRLTLAQVEAALHRAGIPARRKAAA